MTILARTILLTAMALAGIALDAAAQIVVTPGSAAAFVRKPARSGILADSSTSTTTTTTATTTTTTVDQCGLAQASAALGTCCTAANSTHNTRGRATYNAFTLSYSALGSATSLGTAAATTSLVKSQANYWDRVGACW